MDVTVIVPTFNEAPNIAELCGAFRPRRWVSRRK